MYKHHIHKQPALVVTLSHISDQNTSNVKASFDSAFSNASETLTNENARKYVAMYDFEARNPDEINLLIGEIVWV